MQRPSGTTTPPDLAGSCRWLFILLFINQLSTLCHIFSLVCKRWLQVCFDQGFKIAGCVIQVGGKYNQYSPSPSSSSSSSYRWKKIMIILKIIFTIMIIILIQVGGNNNHLHNHLHHHDHHHTRGRKLAQQFTCLIAC